MDNPGHPYFTESMIYPSLVPRPHPLREGRSGAPIPNSWIVPQNEEHPIRSLKDYVITFWSILYRFGRGSGNDIHSD